jgi:hypothetical protein
VLHPDLEVGALEGLHRQLHGGASVASSGGIGVPSFTPDPAARARVLGGRPSAC